MPPKQGVQGSRNLSSRAGLASLRRAMVVAGVISRVCCDVQTPTYVMPCRASLQLVRLELDGARKQKVCELPGCCLHVLLQFERLDVMVKCRGEDGR